jgi:hypothetical protein
MKQETWAKEYRQLWDQLVPERGQAETIQGELIRCTGKITDEAYRNGNINWDASFDQMAQFIGDTLNDSTVFSDAELTKIRKAASEITLLRKSPDVSGPGSPYYYLAEQAVKWCKHREKPIPRVKNPLLRR